MSDTTATATQKSGWAISVANLVWLVVGLLALATLSDLKKTTIHEIESARAIGIRNQSFLKYIAAGRKLTPHEIKQIERFGDLVE